MGTKEELRKIQEAVALTARAEFESQVKADKLPNREKGRTLVRRKGQHYATASSAKGKATQEARFAEGLGEEATDEMGRSRDPDLVGVSFGNRIARWFSPKSASGWNTEDDDSAEAESELGRLIDACRKGEQNAKDGGRKVDYLSLLGIEGRRKITDAANESNRRKSMAAAYAQKMDTEAAEEDDQSSYDRSQTLLDDGAKWDLPEDLLHGGKQGTFFAHIKLLLLISLYARPDGPAHQRHNWIRELALSVLIFEGSLSGLFEYDYAPTSRFVGCAGRISRRIWMNVSQEGLNGMVCEPCQSPSFWPCSGGAVYCIAVPITTPNRSSRLLRAGCALRCTAGHVGQHGAR